MAKTKRNYKSPPNPNATKKEINAYYTNYNNKTKKKQHNVTPVKSVVAETPAEIESDEDEYAVIIENEGNLPYNDDIVGPWDKKVGVTYSRPINQLPTSSQSSDRSSSSSSNASENIDIIPNIKSSKIESKYKKSKNINMSKRQAEGNSYIIVTPEYENIPIEHDLPHKVVENIIEYNKEIIDNRKYENEVVQSNLQNILRILLYIAEPSKMTTKISETDLANTKILKKTENIVNLFSNIFIVGINKDQNTKMSNRTAAGILLSFLKKINEKINNNELNSENYENTIIEIRNFFLRNNLTTIFSHIKNKIKLLDILHIAFANIYSNIISDDFEVDNPDNTTIIDSSSKDGSTEASSRPYVSSQDSSSKAISSNVSTEPASSQDVLPTPISSKAVSNEPASPTAISTVADSTKSSQAVSLTPISSKAVSNEPASPTAISNEPASPTAISNEPASPTAISTVTDSTKQVSTETASPTATKQVSAETTSLTPISSEVVSSNLPTSSTATASLTPISSQVVSSNLPTSSTATASLTPISSQVVSSNLPTSSTATASLTPISSQAISSNVHDSPTATDTTEIPSSQDVSSTAIVDSSSKTVSSPDTETASTESVSPTADSIQDVSPTTSTSDITLDFDNTLGDDLTASIPSDQKSEEIRPSEVVASIKTQPINNDETLLIHNILDQILRDIDLKANPKKSSLEFIDEDKDNDENKVDSKKSIILDLRKLLNNFIKYPELLQNSQNLLPTIKTNLSQLSDNNIQDPSFKSRILGTLELIRNQLIPNNKIEPLINELSNRIQNSDFDHQLKGLLENIQIEINKQFDNYKSPSTVDNQLESNTRGLLGKLQDQFDINKQPSESIKAIGTKQQDVRGLLGKLQDQFDINKQPTESITSVETKQPDVRGLLGKLQDQLDISQKSSAASESGRIVESTQSDIDIMGLLGKVQDQLQIDINKKSDKSVFLADIEPDIKGLLKKIELQLDTDKQTHTDKSAVLIAIEPDIRGLLEKIQNHLISNGKINLSQKIEPNILDLLKNIQKYIQENPDTFIQTEIEQPPETPGLFTSLFQKLKDLYKSNQSNQPQIDIQPQISKNEKNTELVDFISYAKLTEPNYNNSAKDIPNNVKLRVRMAPNTFSKSIRDVDEVFALLKLNAKKEKILKTDDKGIDDGRYLEKTYRFPPGENI
jgi:hypothetical protein